MRNVDIRTDLVSTGLTLLSGAYSGGHTAACKDRVRSQDVVKRISQGKGGRFEMRLQLTGSVRIDASAARRLINMEEDAYGDAH